jgi:hypothetical protein
MMDTAHPVAIEGSQIRVHGIHMDIQRAGNVAALTHNRGNGRLCIRFNP